MPFKWIGLYSLFCVILVCVLVWVSTNMDAIAIPDVAVDGVVDKNVPVTVVLDAGHGGEDCGAVGINGVFEKDINLAITRRIASLLRAAGYRVVETRVEDRLLYDPETVQHGMKKMTDLYNRYQIGRATDNAIFVSIHMNSFQASQKQSGLQIWYGASHAFSKDVAKITQKSAAENLKSTRIRQIVQAGYNMYLMHRAECPAILIECGFLTNPEECEKLSGEKYQTELSFVIFCAMIETINLYGDST